MPRSTPRSHWTRTVRGLVTGLAGLVAAVVMTTTAQAYSYTVTDGFDPKNSTWTKDGSGDHAWFWAGTIGGPVSGWNYARVYQRGPGFSSIVRTVPIPTYAKTCQVRIYLRNYSADPARVTANIEVIRPSDWTYLALRQVSVASTSSAASAWASYSAPTWVSTVPNVVFRVSVLGSSDPAAERILDVDDFALTCSY